MCTGAEIAAVAAAVVGTATTVKAGKDQKAALNAQADAAEAQAEQNRLNAEFEAGQVRKRGEELLSRQRTQAAKSGAESSGSVFDVMRGSAEEIELEALGIEFGAATTEQTKLFEATSSRIAGGQAKTQGTLGGIQVGLSGTSSLLTSRSKTK